MTFAQRGDRAGASTILVGRGPAAQPPLSHDPKRVGRLQGWLRICAPEFKGSCHNRHMVRYGGGGAAAPCSGPSRDRRKEVGTVPAGEERCAVGPAPGSYALQCAALLAAK